MFLYKHAFKQKTCSTSSYLFRSFGIRVQRLEFLLFLFSPSSSSSCCLDGEQKEFNPRRQMWGEYLLEYALSELLERKEVGEEVWYTRRRGRVVSVTRKFSSSSPKSETLSFYSLCEFTPFSHTLNPWSRSISSSAFAILFSLNYIKITRSKKRLIWSHDESSAMIIRVISWNTMPAMIWAERRKSGTGGFESTTGSGEKGDRDMGEGVSMGYLHLLLRVCDRGLQLERQKAEE